MKKKEQKKSFINLEMNPCRYLELLLYITILGAVLRFYNLGFNSLWLDEAATFVNVNTGSFAQMWTNVFNDHHAPLFFIVEWLVHFINSTEFWLRVPSVLAGIATILVIYFLGKEVANEKVGLVAALLLAVSPYHIYYSQEARMYTFTTLFVTLAYYLFFRASKSEDGRYWVLMWLSCAAAFWTHYYTGFVTVPLVIGYFLLRDTKNFKWFLAGGVGAFVLVLPVLTSFVNQAAYLGGNVYTWGLPALLVPLATVQSFSFQNELVAVLSLLLAVLGIWLAYKKSVVVGVTLGIFLLVPILISMVMSSSIPFNVRYHIYLLPLFLVIASIGIERITRIWNNRNALFAAVFLIFVAALIVLPPYYSSYTKEDWRGFSAGLAQTTSIGDVVVVIPGYMQMPLTYYYSNTTDSTILLTANTVEDLQNIAPDRKIFYVVTGDLNAVDPSGVVWSWLQENTKPLGQHTGITLFVKERAL